MQHERDGDREETFERSPDVRSRHRAALGSACLRPRRPQKADQSSALLSRFMRAFVASAIAGACDVANASVISRCARGK
jgi:hypothetical protein